MKARTTSKSALFLMELIIAILFFSVASAVCIRLFVHSHFISEKTININHSVLISQNISECFINAGADKERLLGLLNGILEQPDQIAFYYDVDWNPTNQEQAAFTAVARFYEEDQIHYADITVTDQGENLLHHNLASFYVQNTASSGS